MKEGKYMKYRLGCYEASGNMDKTALTMSDQYSKDHRIKGKTKSAMMYPIILIVITIAVLLIVYLAVLPSFFDIFQNFIFIAKKIFYIRHTPYCTDKKFLICQVLFIR